MGDVPQTWADVTDLGEVIDFYPNTTVRKGISEFINWYKGYYGSV
jgi:UDP-glucuronate 4-epimerase